MQSTDARILFIAAKVGGEMVKALRMLNTGLIRWKG